MDRFTTELYIKPVATEYVFINGSEFELTAALYTVTRILFNTTEDISTYEKECDLNVIKFLCDNKLIYKSDNSYTLLDKDGLLELHRKLFKLQSELLDKKVQYWVSGIAMSDGKPWLWANASGCYSLEEAKNVIKSARDNMNLLDAWVDVYNDDQKTTIYHECFMDLF